MRKKLSDITPYITIQAADAIAAQLEEYKDYEIDTADCHFLNGGDAVVNKLSKMGYRIIDSKSEFNNGIFKHNRRIADPDLSESVYPDKYAQSLKEIYDMLGKFSADTIYSCRNSADFPLVLMTQLFSPQITWYVAEVDYMDFGEYVWKMLYYKNSIPDTTQFEKIMKYEKKLNVLAYNSLYTFEKPDDFSLDGKCSLNKFTESRTWREAFYKIKILPYSICRKVHIPKSRESPYYQVLKNISASLKTSETEKIDLKKFIMGGQL